MIKFNSLLVFGGAILFAFIAGRVAKRLRVPLVIGYVLMGVILGKSFLNIFNPDLVNRMEIVNDLALGIIAFIIGGELNFSRLKRLGRAIFSIAISESLGAFILVSLSTYFFTKDVKISLLLGAVASATAPAATVSVINQYRTKGILTTTILGVVAIDDGIALIIYIFVAGFVSSFLTLSHLHFAKLIFLSLGKILLSLGLGLILGIIISYLGRKVREKKTFFSLTLGVFLLGEGLAISVGLSELLLIMSMAMMMSNLSPHRFVSIMDYFEVVGFPIIAGFFCLAGTRLNINLFTQIGFLAIVYLFARFLGKYLGASLGASLSKAPAVVRRYIGLTLWPQIGVALALAIMVERNFGSLKGGEYLASLAINVLLFTTIITETVGPLATKYALNKAGEIRKFRFKQKGG